ncbi:hypothetical protein DIZ37_10395 [Legionella taurinensis]|nr:hypothetical protein DB746_10395 [Legionella taurinensis]TID41848.1 hypothetical protein DIZ37_10395 [Legionella taurinensis]
MSKPHFPAGEQILVQNPQNLSCTKMGDHQITLRSNPETKNNPDPNRGPSAWVRLGKVRMADTSSGKTGERGRAETARVPMSCPRATIRIPDDSIRM